MRAELSSEQRKRRAAGLCVAPGCETRPKINPVTGRAYWLCWDHAKVDEPVWLAPVQLPPAEAPVRGREPMRNRAKQREAFRLRRK